MVSLGSAAGVFISLVASTAAALQREDPPLHSSVSQTPPAEPSQQKTAVLYLGIRLAEFSNLYIQSLARDALRTVQSRFADGKVDEDLRIIEAMRAASTEWQYPYEPHVTSMYVGGLVPSNPEDRAALLGFKEDRVLLSDYPAIVYIPNKLMAATAMVDRSQIYMKNRFPHTTLLTRGMAAKYSNDLIESLFDGSAQFARDYDDKFAHADLVSKYEATIEGVKYSAYVVARLSVSKTGYTHRFYTA